MIGIDQDEKPGCERRRWEDNRWEKRLVKKQKGK